MKLNVFVCVLKWTFDYRIMLVISIRCVAIGYDWPIVYIGLVNLYVCVIILAQIDLYIAFIYIGAGRALCMFWYVGLSKPMVESVYRLV